MELQVPARSHQGITMCINRYTEFFMQSTRSFVYVYMCVCVCPSVRPNA